MCIDQNETRRYAGLKGQTNFPDTLIEQACTEALIMTTPKGTWNTYPYNATTQTILSNPPLKLTSTNLSRHLEKAVEVVIIAVTIGEQIETKISELFTAGNYTLGLLLDAAGTAAVETVADAINNFITVQNTNRGLQPIWRFSPGYGDWSITDQPHILALADGSSAGIKVTPSCMLMPRKSVTAIIGLVPKEIISTSITCNKTSCERCSHQNCLARKESQT
ncbi:MAG: Vitamin dependent methionine synthase activation region [Firmicutes bacterium]|nr:Vitamin dependent methionine synthase activation region [Bacillota bacterium]